MYEVQIKHSEQKHGSCAVNVHENWKKKSMNDRLQQRPDGVIINLLLVSSFQKRMFWSVF